MRTKNIRKNISHDYYNGWTYLEYRCKDGTKLREKYLGYRLSECYDKFINKYKQILD